ncbi:MAG: UDP-N-acetylmuramoyl-L-alanine--D-glutamate ligase [Chlamydiales bacterium]|nr:UDP-N-acetylmuramoyl-L-alanine--D-glutamate ligase [Chlamydiales bacterium]
MKKALILGLGVSGRSAAEFLLKKGYAVTAVEKSADLLESNPEIKQLIKNGLTSHKESAVFEKFDFDLLVPSPGVPQKHPLYARAIEEGIEVVGEAELAFRHMKQRAVAITGTNGKTTVTLLVEHILNKSGRKARALGNVGEPLTRYFLNPDPDEIVVAELSSYQLETMNSQVFDAAALLNITPDHLDRYPDMVSYAKAKCSIEKNLKPRSPLFVHEQVLPEFGSLFESRAFLTFGSNPTSHFWTDKEKVYQGEKVEYLLPLVYRGRGSHESENALAAWLLVREFGVTGEQFIQALNSFSKPSHRIEFVAKIEEVSYFDDSKGTNLDAVIRAVEAVPDPVILIAGGVDKGASYTPWIQAFQGKVKRIVAMGQAAQKIRSELGEAIQVEIVTSMEEAVCFAEQRAEKGGSVLLSPGCASFDMFRDYAHRGEEFKRCVNELEERSEKNT